MPKRAKRWSLNNRQFVQSQLPTRITYRQIGGKHYRGVSLSLSQFNELDKYIGCDKQHFAYDLGDNLYFCHPCPEVYTLRKQSKKHKDVDVAYFCFKQTAWKEYLNSVHNEIKSLVSEDC